MTNQVVRRSWEPPVEWLAALRAVSPKSHDYSWLYLRWHPDAERWMCYEMVPEKYLDRDWVEELNGPHPDTRPDWDRIASVFQWEMWRQFRVHARPSWVIQGTKGGHLYDYDEATKELCKAVGLPPVPPKAGSLPYAPFDNRVTRQLLRMNKLLAAKNDLTEFRKRHTGEGFQRTLAEQKKQARAEYVRFLEDQMEEGAEYFIKASKMGELDDTKPRDVDWMQKDELATANYIEHGRFVA